MISAIVIALIVLSIAVLAWGVVETRRTAKRTAELEKTMEQAMAKLGLSEERFARALKSAVDHAFHASTTGIHASTTGIQAELDSAEWGVSPQ